jgi:hypothetical protein
MAHLTAFDTHEHPLATRLGRGYHSATLRQCLGPLERLEAAEALLSALVPEPVGTISSVDGHMIASWTRVSMQKGKITMLGRIMLGRIMAGSPAVIAPNEAGQACFVAYDPPDLHVSRVIVASCQKVVKATGTSLFVIDRAVNSVAMACAFAQRGWGLLGMLDDNEHASLARFEATQASLLEDGTKG